MMADYPGRLRFVNYNGTSSIAGRLEIYLNGVWCTMCVNRFGTGDASYTGLPTARISAMGLLINLGELKKN